MTGTCTPGTPVMLEMFQDKSFPPVAWIQLNTYWILHSIWQSQNPIFVFRFGWWDADVVFLCSQKRLPIYRSFSWETRITYLKFILKQGIVNKWSNTGLYSYFSFIMQQKMVSKISFSPEAQQSIFKLLVFSEQQSRGHRYSNDDYFHCGLTGQLLSWSGLQRLVDRKIFKSYT